MARSRLRLSAVPLVLCALLLAAPASAGPAGDPLRAQQWGLDQVHAPEAWQLTRGRGVTVAVVDSGVDPDHPDLQGALLPGRAFDGTGSARDDCGHGTEVAGIIAARRGNGIGIAGVAPEARILPLKDGAGCTVDTFAMNEAIRYAADQGARVINISQSSVPVVGDAIDLALFRSSMQAAVDHAWSKGSLVVAGAGNGSTPLCGYPAAIERVVCVGALTESGQRASYSQGEVRPEVDLLMAPGGGSLERLLWTTRAQVTHQTGKVPRGYVEVSGTSFAAPHVSGVAALLFSRGFSAAQVRERLLTTATDLGLPGRDPVFGWGAVDAGAALRGAPRS